MPNIRQPTHSKFRSSCHLRVDTRTQTKLNDCLLARGNAYIPVRTRVSLVEFIPSNRSNPWNRLHGSWSAHRWAKMLESSQQRLLIPRTIAIVIGHGSTKKKRPQEWASSFLSSSISSRIFLSSSQPSHIRFRDFYSARFLSFFPPFISLYLTVLFHPARFLRSRDLLSRGSREATLLDRFLSHLWNEALAEEEPNDQGRTPSRDHSCSS